MLRYENETEEQFPFSAEEQAKKLIHVVCEYFHCPYETEVSLILVGKKEIAKMNETYRNVTGSTDVLSFPMVDFDVPGAFEGDTFEQTKSISLENNNLLLGDIVVCSPIVKEQAKGYGHSEEREFSFLIVHSLLHLIGFDHINETERIQMEERQEEILSKCNIHR